MTAMQPPRRVRTAIAFAAGLIAATFAAPASALVELDVTRGNVQPLPIAIPAFVADGQDVQLGADIAGVISADLQRSGLFLPVDPAMFIQASVGPYETPRFGDWTAVNAQALVTGAVTRRADGRLQADVRLWDVFSGQQMLGEQYFTSPENWRRVAHVIADAIYERITGEKGYFDTRIVFVEESGPKDARSYRLAMMDQDGANVSYLTQEGEIVLTPRFNPSSAEIAYISYRGGQPQVYLMNIDTRQTELVGNFPGMSLAPRFSPDGQKIILSLQPEGSANIFTIDLRSRRTTRLTDGAAIDISPSYSPDGSQIAFLSDRGGSQQLYVMNANGSNPHRITFGEGSYETPVWSPRGDFIAFTRRHAGRFAIGVIRPDGTDERILTEGFHNEGPTWAPNGRVLMFWRNSPGPNGGPQLWTIDLNGYHEARVPTPAFASDPAWSPLLN